MDVRTEALAARASAALQINGQDAQTNPNSATTHDVVVKFPVRSVVATVTFGDTDTVAARIVGSFVDSGTGK